MPIDKLSDIQLISIVNHARKRERRYNRMVRELNCAIVDNMKNAKEALEEIERRQLAVRNRLGSWAMDNED